MKKKIIVPLIVLFIIIASFINIEITKESVLRSINTYFNYVFPFTFPFLFLTTLFIKINGGHIIAYAIQKITYKLLRINSYETIVLICSILGGYPSSSIYCSLFYNQKLINLKSCKHLINNASFPSFLFFLGTINSIIKDTKLSVIIYLSIIISGFILIRKRKQEEYHLITKNDISKEIKKISIFSILFSIKESIESAVKTTLLIISSFVFCSVISNIFTFYIPEPLNVFFSTFIEFSESSINILKLELPEIIKYNTILFATTFGGVSILVQIYTNSPFLHFDLKSYFLSKIKHALLACLIFNTIYIFFII